MMREPNTGILPRNIFLTPFLLQLDMAQVKTDMPFC